MNYIKQRSTWAGIATIFAAIAGVLAGAIDPAMAVGQIASGAGLIAVNA